MFYHDQDVAIHRPLSVVISSVFILDPSLLPLKKSPLEEEIQDSKTLYYYPQSVSIHTKRNYIGLVEGVMVFTDGFGEGHSDCLMVDADSHSLEAKIVEKNLIIAVICIGAEARPVLEAFCRHFSLFYGRFSFWRQEDGHMKKEFRAVMDHFVEMFTALGSTGEMIDKINPSRFLPVGIERFGLQKTQFIVTNQIDNLLKVLERLQGRKSQG